MTSLGYGSINGDDDEGEEEAAELAELHIGRRPRAATRNSPSLYDSAYGNCRGTSFGKLARGLSIWEPSKVGTWKLPRVCDD